MIQLGMQNMKTARRAGGFLLALVMLIGIGFSGVVRAASASFDFSIYDGHLIRYFGTSQTVVIPEGIKYIDEQAFQDAQVKTIVLPKSLKFIGRWAFSGSQITGVVIPAGAAVGDAAFAACDQLTSVAVSEGVKYINDSAFSNCTQLTRVQLPNTLLRVGQDAFQNTPWLENNPNDFVIASGLLLRYSNKTAASAAIPQGVKIIYARAFSDRTNLKSVVIPPSVKEIQAEAFANSGLVSVTIPKTVEKIDVGAFARSKNLKEVNWPSNITMMKDGMFADCTSLKSIAIPEGVTLIGSEAFKGCTALEQVNLPQSMKTLASRMLADCESMRSLTVPAGVENIGSTLIEVSKPGNWLQTHLFRLIGTKGSYAEAFAKRNGYEFVPVGTAPPKESGSKLIYSGRLYQGAVMMDTRSYRMAPGNIYDIGVKLFGNASSKTRQMVSGSTSVATVMQLPNDNYRITAKRPGTVYITLYILEPKGPRKEITHASIRFDVETGIKQGGQAWRQTTYFN